MRRCLSRIPSASPGPNARNCADAAHDLLASAAFLTYAGALAVLDAEANTDGANIKTFGDALWWAMTTITTVGYGDDYPVTVIGRLVAAGLMIGGIAVLGVVTASVASWLVDNVSNATATEVESMEAPLRDEIAKLAERIQNLTLRLAAHADTTSAPGNDHRW